MKLKKTQEISEETQETTQETTQEVPIKPKRVMSEAQKENLVKARAKAFDLRKQLKDKTGGVKKPTKLEKRLKDIEDVDIEEVDDVVKVEPVLEEEKPVVVEVKKEKKAVVEVTPVVKEKVTPVVEVTPVVVEEAPVVVKEEEVEVVEKAKVKTYNLVKNENGFFYIV